MSSDRSAMQRGTVPRTAPTTPAGRRPPSVPRERKPALAALALLLIVGGALGAGYLVLASGHRVAAIEISEQVGTGQRIPLAAMREVRIASGSGLEYVPWADAGQVARYDAASVIPPGTLLTSAMVARAASLTAGKAVVGLALKDGQLPGGLQVGDHVDIYQVSDSAESCPSASGATLATGAVVLAISVPSATSGSAAADVEVALDPADAGAVACNAANGIVAVAVVPDAGSATAQPDPASSPAVRGSPPATGSGHGVPAPSAGRTGSAAPSAGRTGSASPAPPASPGHRAGSAWR